MTTLCSPDPLWRGRGGGKVNFRPAAAIFVYLAMLHIQMLT